MTAREDHYAKYGRLRIIPPPLAKEGELEHERARLVGKRVVHSAFRCSHVDLEEGTVWASFRGEKDGRQLSYRWVATTCVLMPEKFQ